MGEKSSKLLRYYLFLVIVTVSFLMWMLNEGSSFRENLTLPNIKETDEGNSLRGNVTLTNITEADEGNSLLGNVTLTNITEDDCSFMEISMQEKLTSTNFSTFEILNQPTLGEFLKIRIQAKSHANSRKHEGGDFWFAVLSSLNTTGSSSAPVIDHGNGTYSVSLFVGWPGRVDVNITLVHPSLAVNFIDKVRNMSDFSRVYWKGTFKEGYVKRKKRGKNKSGKKRRTATSLCYLSYHGPEFWKDKCAYTNAKALGNNTAWVCDKPPRGFTCDSLVEYSTEVKKIDKTFRDLAGKSGLMCLFQGANYRTRLTNGPEKLTVHTGDVNSSAELQAASEQFRRCNIGKKPTNPGSGFWLADTWKSLTCKTAQWIKEGSTKVGECLRNRDVYLLGDSTTRQWFTQLLRTFGVSFSLSDVRLSYKYYDPKYKFNLTFQFHPHILSKAPISIKKQQFEVDVLDSLQSSQCNYVVAISPWAHFSQWWVEAYAVRLNKIRAAIQRFKQRCPGAPIILKGPHVREETSPEFQLMKGDYILFMIKVMMEEILNVAGVCYINVWDMNLAYPVEKYVHMPDAVVNQELDIFLSHICPDLV